MTKKLISIILSLVLAFTAVIAVNAAYENHPTDTVITQRELDQLEESLYIATQGIVLMENNGVLPLSTKTVALYGGGARRTLTGGGGSGATYPRNVVNVEKGLENAGYTIVPESKAWMQEQEGTIVLSADSGSSASGNFNNIFTNARRETVSVADYLSDATDTAIYVLSRTSSEGADRAITSADGGTDYELTPVELANLRAVAAHYDNVVVVLNIGGIIDMKWYGAINADIPDGIDAVVHMSQLGQIGGTAIERILSGKTSPSGKLTDTWAVNYSDYPSASVFSTNDGITTTENYIEGIYVGYRYFDTFGLDVAYPFGYGLSYTTFDIDLVDASIDASRTTVKVNVTNTGSMAGKEVVQVYFSAPAIQGVNRLDKPFQELAAYAKTDNLKPGESQELTISFLTTEMSSYDEALAAYILENGTYTIRVGNSSRNTKIAATATLAGDLGYVITEQLSNQLETVVTDDTMTSKVETGYLGDSVLSGWDEAAAGPNFDTASAFDNAATLTMSFADFVAPNNASEYDDQKAVTYITESQAENYANGRYWNDAIRPYADTDTEKMGHDEEVVIVPDVPEGTKLIDVYNGTVSLESFVASMTMEELAYTTEGVGGYAADPSFPWNVTIALGSPGYGVDRYEQTLGIPTYAWSDGPAGLRIRTAMVYDGITYYQYATAMPIGTAIAQAWDYDVSYRAGSLIGLEQRLFGATVWLAPGMNIHRNPLCGRNFEYLSEDPTLSGLTAAGETDGCQSHAGVGVSIKHFAGNEQEVSRFGGNTTATERTWREIYLKGFEIVVKNSAPMTIMSSYNRLNGVYSSADWSHLYNILRGEWGYNGVVETDWYGVHGDLRSVISGNDDIQPGGNGRTIYNDMILDESNVAYVNDDGTLFTGAFTNAAGGETVISREFASNFTVPTTLYTSINGQDEQGNFYTQDSLIKQGLASVEYVAADGTRTAIVDNDAAGTHFADINPSSYVSVVISYFGEYSQTTYAYVGDVQRSVLNILRMTLNVCQMEELYDGYKTRSFTEFYTSEEFDRLRTVNKLNHPDLENGILDYVKSEKGNIDFIITAPQTAKAGEVFTIYFDAPADVIGVKIFNESGRQVTVKAKGFIPNEDGTNEWRVRLSVATAGDRTFTVVPISKVTQEAGESSFSIVITDDSEPNLLTSAGFRDAAATKNVATDVIAVGGKNVQGVKVYNESGTKMGARLVSRTTNDDGTRTFVYGLVIGTKGDNRTFTFRRSTDYFQTNMFGGGTWRSSIDDVTDNVFTDSIMVID